MFGVRLSAVPVVNSEPGTVPFGISFDVYGHLVIAESGPNALATFALTPGGTVSLIDAVPTGASATCWVAPAGPFLFAGNAGNASESGYSSSFGGQLSLLGAATTDSGTVDASAAAGGTEYLAQVRETILLTGRLEPEDLSPQQRDEFVELYRRWRSEGSEEQQAGRRRSPPRPGSGSAAAIGTASQRWRTVRAE